MKKLIRNIFFLNVIVMGLMSCSDSDYDMDNLVPSQYHKILYFKNSGVNELALNTTQTNYKDSALIIKAGSDPTLSAKVNVRVLSQSEVDEAYPNNNYSVVPQDAYSFDDDLNVAFSSSEKYKYVHYTIHADKAYKAKVSTTDKLVLPLMLSSENDTINASKNISCLLLDVKIPVVAINSDMDESMVYKSLKFNINASLNYLDHNDWDISASLGVPDNAAELVSTYNATKGVDYKLLPSGTYTLPSEVQLTKGNLEAAAEITVSRSKLVSDENYVLPVKLTGTNMGDQMKSSEAIRYIVVHNPKYGYVIPDRSTWKILFCNEDGMHTNTGTPVGYGAPAMIDNDPSTYWMYARPNDYNTDFKNSDDYDYDFKDYHAFFGDRKVSGQQAIVIDMGEARHIIGVGIQQAQTEDCFMLNCSFSVSDDSQFKFVPYAKGGDIADYWQLSLNNWTHILTWNGIPTNRSMNYMTVTDAEKAQKGMKGRFLKINPLKGSWGGSSQGSRIAEVVVMELVSVDGEAIK